MTAKTRLELTWIGKENRPRVEPRILIEDERLSHHAATRREGDLFDNLLIHGDNLLALRALEQDFTGKVKCVFIDPPYDVDDDEVHGVLAALQPLLADDAVICVERSTRSGEPTLPDGLELERRKDYGETVLFWLAPAGESGS